MKLPPFVRLDNPVRHYAWGSADFIPDLLERTNPHRKPHAELWIGAHPSAPSMADLEGETIDLNALLSRHFEDAVGRPASAGDRTLPFLFKVLAADKPLSIQAHPDREQARAGFAREDAAGIPRDAPERNYRDPHHKPELVVALDDFWALEGFRDPLDIASDLERLGVSVLDDVVAALRETEGLRRGFERLMTRPAAVAARALGELRAGLPRLSPQPRRFAEQLLTEHPHDVGVFSIVFLNLVHLRPFEGLFVPARRLHAYLRGAALEIMASSDNVLRGGLTPKHVDVPELLGTLAFHPTAPQRIRPIRRGPRWEYPTPAVEFRLSRLDLTGDRVVDAPRTGLEIVLCTAGAATLRGANGDPLHLRRGQTVLIPATTPSVTYEGDATLWLAAIPPQPPTSDSGS